MNSTPTETQHIEPEPDERRAEHLNVSFNIEWHIGDNCWSLLWHTFKSMMLAGYLMLCLLAKGMVLLVHFPLTGLTFFCLCLFTLLLAAQDEN
jgi:hypothetical protein